MNQQSDHEIVECNLEQDCTFKEGAVGTMRTMGEMGKMMRAVFEKEVDKIIDIGEGDIFSKNNMKINMSQWSNAKKRIFKSVKLIPNSFVNKTYYKVMSNTLRHRGFQYSFDDLNILKGVFDPNPLNLSNGLYFCDLNDVYRWFHLHPQGIVCEITLPEEAIVYKQDRKYKTDRMYIKNPMDFEDFVVKHKLSKSVLKNNKLKYFSNHDKVIVDAINKNISIIYLDKSEPNYESYIMLALEKRGINLQHIKNPSHDMIMSAVKQNGKSIKYVKPNDLTYDMIMCAVKQNGNALKNLNHMKIAQCKEYLSSEFSIEAIYVAAVKQNKKAVQYIDPCFLTDNILNIVNQNIE